MPRTTTQRSCIHCGKGVNSIQGHLKVARDCSVAANQAASRVKAAATARAALAALAAVNATNCVKVEDDIDANMYPPPPGYEEDTPDRDTPPAYACHRPRDAAKTYGKRQTAWETYCTNEDPMDPYAPWSGESEFRIVEFLATAGLSQSKIDAFLKLPLVSSSFARLLCSTTINLAVKFHPTGDPGQSLVQVCQRDVQETRGYAEWA